METELLTFLQSDTQVFLDYLRNSPFTLSGIWQAAAVAIGSAVVSKALEGDSGGGGGAGALIPAISKAFKESSFQAPSRTPEGLSSKVGNFLSTDRPAAPPNVSGPGITDPLALYDEWAARLTSFNALESRTPK